jgi:adenine-specific DNA-methyltransferase
MDTNNFYRSYLKEIREIRGGGPQDVAEKNLINYTSLSRIETGKRLPTNHRSKVTVFYNYSEQELIKQLISDKIIYEVQMKVDLKDFILLEQN